MIGFFKKNYNEKIFNRSKSTPSFQSAENIDSSVNKNFLIDASYKKKTQNLFKFKKDKKQLNNSNSPMKNSENTLFNEFKSEKKFQTNFINLFNNDDNIFCKTLNAINNSFFNNSLDNEICLSDEDVESYSSFTNPSTLSASSSSLSIITSNNEKSESSYIHKNLNECIYNLQLSKDSIVEYSAKHRSNQIPFYLIQKKMLTNQNSNNNHPCKLLFENKINPKKFRTINYTHKEENKNSVYEKKCNSILRLNLEKDFEKRLKTVIRTSTIKNFKIKNEQKRISVFESIFTKLNSSKFKNNEYLLYSIV